MLKLKPNCAVCTAVRDNKKLLNRIYNSSWFIAHSKDSLLAIANDCTELFSYQSLKNHVKRHQFLNARDYTEKMTKLAAKKAEDGLAHKATDAQSVWDVAMAMGMEKLKQGDMEIKLPDLLKAAKDKSDYLFKKSDQQIAILETIAHFSSGENTNNERIYDRRTVKNTIESPEDIDSWQDQSDTFRQQLAGGPLASGPGEVPVGNL